MVVSGVSFLLALLPVSQPLLLANQGLVQSPQASTPADGPSPNVFDDLIPKADRICAARRHTAAAWPGFWHQAKPLMLTRRRGQAMLLVAPQASSGFVPIEQTHACSPSRLFVRTGFTEDLGPLGMNPAAELMGTRVPALPVGVVPDSDFLEFFFHEAFHGYQDAAFSSADEIRTGFGKPSIAPEQIAGPDFAALAEVERRLLAEALKASGGNFRTSMRTYLALRARRSEGRPDLDRVENYFERLEGTAQYVGLVIRHRHERRAGLTLGERIAERNLVQPLHELSEVVESDSRMMRSRLYGTGAALAYALDRLRARDWRERIERGESSLRDLVAQAVGFDASRSQHLVARALEEHGFAQLRTEWDQRLKADATKQ